MARARTAPGPRSRRRETLEAIRRLEAQRAGGPSGRQAARPQKDGEGRDDTTSSCDAGVVRCYRDLQGRPVRVPDGATSPEVLGPDGRWAAVSMDVEQEAEEVTPERFASDCRVYVALGLAGLDR